MASVANELLARCLLAHNEASTARACMHTCDVHECASRVPAPMETEDRQAISARNVVESLVRRPSIYLLGAISLTRRLPAAWRTRARNERAR